MRNLKASAKTKTTLSFLLELQSSKDVTQLFRKFGLAMKYLCSILICLFSIQHNAFSTQQNEERFVKGQILVQLQPDVSPKWLEEFFSQEKNKLHLIVKEQVSTSWNMWLFETEPGSEQLALQIAYSTKLTKAAQLNHYVSLRSVAPNDTEYNRQWNLNNTGQNNGTPGADIKAEKAWQYATGGTSADGDTIVIAIIDGGIDVTHQDLNLWKNKHEIPNNGIDDDANGYIDDYDGWNTNNNTGQLSNDNHGTHVAGIAGAIGNNNIGIAGVNWDVKIMPVQVDDYTDANVAAAYSYVFYQRKRYDETGGLQGAFVVATNASFGENFANAADYPLWCGIYDSLGSLGILNTGATINASIDVDVRGDMPTTCASDFLITITNITRINALANAGFGKIHIDLGAPGTQVYSCFMGNSYGNLTGTSMAAPHVAGVVSLLFAAGCDSFIQAYKNNPAQVALKVKETILNGVDPITALKDKTLTGGRLNAYRSVLLLLNEFCAECKLDLNVTAKSISCKGLNDGEIDVEVLNGTPPYIFDWSDGVTSQRSSNTLQRGNYFINIIDSNDCLGLATVNIFEPNALTINVNVNDATVGEANGSANAGIIGGSPPYQIVWSDANNTTTNTVNNLAVGEYSVMVTDANSCVETKSFMVGTVSSVQDYTEEFFSFYPNPAKDFITIHFSNNKPEDFDWQLYDISGKTILKNKHTMYNSFTISVQQFPRGVYFLKLQNDKFSAMRKIILQ